jgi:L-seryl-tRNA(Ser) seleniumtransferase
VINSNNNAAAVVLALRALARGREVIVSRGELVEIGGSFRLPEIMEVSGARLKEIGTTNRTRLSDYERAIGKKTALLLKVHPSNYRIEGFSEEVSPADLAKLGKKFRIPVMYDLGSATLEDLKGLNDTILHAADAVQSGVDLLSFSGDKLLGGPQAGVVLGKRTLIEKLRSDPWLRILRVDKLSLALLERVIRSAGKPGRSSSVAYLMKRTPDELRMQATALRKLLIPHPAIFRLAEAEIESAVGGGSLPQELIPSFGVAISGDDSNLMAMEAALRTVNPPVIGRHQKGKLVFDLRTVFPDEMMLLANACRKAMDTVQKETR